MTMFHAADFEPFPVRRPGPKLVNNSQARLNRMHVRTLLEEKQPGFAALLESVVREFALNPWHPDRAPALGQGICPHVPPWPRCPELFRAPARSTRASRR